LETAVGIGGPGDAGTHSPQKRHTSFGFRSVYIAFGVIVRLRQEGRKEGKREGEGEGEGRIGWHRPAIIFRYIHLSFPPAMSFPLAAAIESAQLNPPHSETNERQQTRQGKP
jgi:hypothetical protein